MSLPWGEPATSWAATLSPGGPPRRLEEVPRLGDGLAADLPPHSCTTLVSDTRGSRPYTDVQVGVSPIPSRMHQCEAGLATSQIVRGMRLHLCDGFLGVFLGVSILGACRGAPFSEALSRAPLLPALPRMRSGDLKPTAALSCRLFGLFAAAAAAMLAAASAASASPLSDAFTNAGPPFALPLALPLSATAFCGDCLLLGGPAAANPAASDRRAKPGAGSGLASELPRLLVGDACSEDY